MKVWIVTNKQETMKWVSPLSESHAWNSALNKIPDGATRYEMVEAFKAIGWKCTEYVIFPVDKCDVEECVKS